MIDNKAIITWLVVFYVIKIYVSLIIYKLGLIDDLTWVKIHYLGSAILYFTFFYLLRDKTNDLIYSVAIAITSTRLYTQLRDGFEEEYEMLCVFTLTIIIYFIKKYKLIKKIKEWLLI